MARDRFDDVDDRDDRSYDDRDDDRGDRSARPDLRAAARGKTMIPGVLLVLVGSAAFLFSLTLFILALTNPAAVMEYYNDNVMIPLANMQPPSPQRDQQLAEFRLRVALAKAHQKQTPGPYGRPEGVAYNLVILSLCALVIAGGVALIRVKGYAVAMIGSILGIFPFCFFFCLPAPIGLWGLIVLFNPTVKAGFSGRRALR